MRRGKKNFLFYINQTRRLKMKLPNVEKAMEGKGDGSTAYLSTVFGASEPSSFRPEDLDLEGQSL